MSALWLLIGLLLGAAAATAALGPRARTAAQDADRREHALEGLLAPVREQLRRVDAQLDTLDRDRHELSGRLEAQLRSLVRSSEGLRVETGALVTALRKPNTRGQWGQMQLRRVVELAGLVAHCDFSEQVGLGEGLRPDLVVNLPGGKHVVVDAKAPLQGVLDAYEARDDAERSQHLRAHARLLRAHVTALAAKAYGSELASAPDLVVLFLPGEHLYGTALEADPALLEDAMARRVLIATPTTLLAILRAVAYGWQQERVAESAQAVADLGRELQRRLVRLSSLLATLGIRLAGAVRAFNEAAGSYEARVLPSVRRLAEHGAGSTEATGAAPEQITTAPRIVADPPAAAAAGPRPA